VPNPEPLLVITHGGAGHTDDEELRTGLAVLRGATSVEVATTADPGELDGVLHRAGSRRIVVAGGDGSIHAVVAALHRRRELAGSTLGLLPLGTGNDFARACGIPREITDAARVVLDGVPAPRDLLVDEVGEVVVNNVHVGAGAAAARRASRWKDRLRPIGVGKVNLAQLGYPIGAAITAWNPPVIRLRVEVDGRCVVDFDTPLLQVAIGNGASVGGGLELTPDADPGDRQADVMISRATGPVSRLVYAVRLALGRHTEDDDVDYLHAQQVTISGEQFWVSADGETYGPERHRSWHLEPAAYRLVVPADGDSGQTDRAD